MPLAQHSESAAADTTPPPAGSDLAIGTVRNWVANRDSTGELDSEPEAILRDLDDKDPARADRLRDAIRRFPAVGTELAGFRLVALLGKGAFGRVYLARQGDLAGRLVALKVSADLSGESQTLAQLQHTNIVPVYSVHRAEPYQAVCMPYLGPITLAGLLNRCRQRKALPMTGRELVTTLNGLVGDTEIEAGLPASRPSTLVPEPGGLTSEPSGTSFPERPAAVLQLLCGLSYVDAVCWIGSRLADALAHAHERGIVHNDLKPANVLVADDGQPMLLDFGVSNDLKLRAEAPNAPIGGTLPYMSPEQLASSRGGDWVPEPRSDVYALGVILYELLTGVHPFRLPTDGMAREVDRMVAERRAGPPRLLPRHPSVTPGLEAIIRKALEPDPARRYQTAAALREDLDRHRTDQPLLHARVPSVRERLRKWSRRHPRLSSNATLSLVAAGVIATLAFGLDRRARRLDRFEAEATLRAADPDLQAARYLLISRAPSSEMVAAGVVRSRATLDRYELLTDPNWERQTRYSALTEDEQKQVRTHLAEACVLLARGSLLDRPTGSDAPERLRDAVRLNERAEQLYGDAVPRTLWLQRAELYKRLGEDATARQFDEHATRQPIVSARDHFLLGREALTHGRPRAALALLEKAADLEPTLFWAHFAQGLCHEELGQYAQARACYTTAIALWPKFAWAHYNRGLVLLRLGEFARAKTDLDRVVELDPRFADGYLNRALASAGLSRTNDAIADLNKAGELGASASRVSFTRAWVRERAGDAAGAKRDLDEGMRREPTDEAGWIARGTARMKTDPAGAAADFDAVLRQNPGSLIALQNRAHVLGKLGRNEDALVMLDRAVEHFPDFALSRIGRGVLHARLAHWAAAEADARESLRRDDTPAIQYQAADVFALLSRHDPKYKAEALRLLTQALRGGYGFEHIEDDKDLDPIRSDPAFVRVRAGADALKQK